MPYYNQQQVDQKVDGEKYLNMAITGIIELPTKLLAENPQLKTHDFVVMRRILINQLEALALSTGKIKLVDKVTGYELNEYTENQKALKLQLVEFFKKDNPELGIGADSKAKMVLRFIIEGEYTTKLEMMEEKLAAMEKEGKLSKEERNDKMADFKFSEIVSSAIAGKVKRVELDG